MSVIMNLLWAVLGGIVVFAFYMLGGIALCFTIIGIPWGFQCFKMGIFALFPFGSETRMRQAPDNTELLNVILNVIWLVFGGLQLVILHFILGVLLCVTIIGIPFGIQHFKMVKLGFMPFGREVIDLPA